MQNGYMVYVEGKQMPMKIHDIYDNAISEAHRLAKQNVGQNIYITNIVHVVCAQVVVEQVYLSRIGF